MQRLLDFPIRQTFAATLVAYCGHIEELCLYAGGGWVCVCGGGGWTGPMFIVASNGPIEPL